MISQWPCFTIKTVLILTPAAGICLPCRRILPGVPLCRRTPCTPGRTMSQWPFGSSGAWWADRGTCCPVCPSDKTSTSDLGTRETLGNTEPKQSCRRTSKPKKMRIFTSSVSPELLHWSACSQLWRKLARQIAFIIIESKAIIRKNARGARARANLCNNSGETEVVYILWFGKKPVFHQLCLS